MLAFSDCWLIYSIVYMYIPNRMKRSLDYHYYIKKHSGTVGENLINFANTDMLYICTFHRLIKQMFARL